MNVKPIQEAALNEAKKAFEKPWAGNQTETVSALMEAAARMKAPALVGAGSIVVWKPGLRNRLAIEYGQPMIVAGVAGVGESMLADPTSGEAMGGLHQQGIGYREPLDMVVGVILADGQFVEFFVDSRRVELLETAEQTSSFGDDA